MSLGIHYNVEAPGDFDLNSYIHNPEVFNVVDGYVDAPTGPGLGIEINEDLVREVAKAAVPWPLGGFVGEDGGIREW